MIFLESLLIVLISGSIVFYIASAFCTQQFFREKLEVEKNSKTPPVSLMIPVRGLDAGAWENWSALCTQNYPNYEVLFGVMEESDPAIPVLKTLAETYKERVRLFVGLPPRGMNHKDSNLSYLLEEAKHEIIIFADSDIRPHCHYIRTVIQPLENPDVGLVSCAFMGRSPQSLGAAMASFGRCFDFIPSALIARIVDGGVRFAVGVTMATRKTTLKDFGGLHLNRIGSDYNLGKRAAEAGYQVELSHYILESDTGTESVLDVFKRELRWARTIRYNRGLQYYTMVFCYGSLYCLPLLLLTGFSKGAIALTLVTWGIRYFQVSIALYSVEGYQLLPWLWGLPLRELLSFIIWLMGAYGQRVYWRGRWLRVYGDGLITQ